MGIRVANPGGYFVPGKAAPVAEKPRKSRMARKPRRPVRKPRGELRWLRPRNGLPLSSTTPSCPAFLPSPLLLSSPPLLLKTPQASNRCTDWFFKTLPRLDRHRDHAPPRQAPGSCSASTGTGPLLRLDRHRDLSPPPCSPRNGLASGLAAAGGVYTPFCRSSDCKTG